MDLQEWARAALLELDKKATRGTTPDLVTWRQVEVLIRAAIESLDVEEFRELVPECKAVLEDEHAKGYDAGYETGRDDGYDRGQDDKRQSITEDGSYDYDGRPYGCDVDALERAGFTVLARYNGMIPGTPEWDAAEEYGAGSVELARIASPQAAWYQIDKAAG